jgi:hypothetical protein
MTAGDTVRADRDSPLPNEMQGRWLFEHDGHSELVIRGGEIICLGKIVDYDHKEIIREDGALTVNLRVEDGKDEDSSQRSNVTGLTMTPDGDFVGWNVKWGASFVRADAGGGVE